MDLNLKNHTAVVIGGASGIGRAVVEEFVTEGVNVAVWDVSSQTISIAAQCGAVCGICVDICDRGQIATALNSTLDALGGIQHLVHAAAIGSGKYGAPFTRLEPDDWSQVLQVNLQGLVNVAHAVTPVMRDQGDEGTIVCVASVAGQIGSSTDPPYTASKAANISFAQVMARDLATDRIRVNTVCPGMVQTPLNRQVWEAWHACQPESRRLSYEEWADRKIAELVPLGRWQQAQDVADMVVFLSSERAAQVTGQTINVDGGYVMHW